jgi:hypothetical protein
MKYIWQDDSHHVLGTFLISSLGRITMGSIGMASIFDSEKLPPLPRQHCYKTFCGRNL